MIAAWMLYVTVITILTGIVALAAESGLRTIRLPARFAWLGAIALVWLFAAIAAVSHPANPDARVAVVSQRIAPAPTNGLSTSASAPVSKSNTLFIEPNSPLAKLAHDVLIAASPDAYLQPADLSARHCQLFVVDLLYLLIAQSNFDRTTRLLAASGAAVASRRRPLRGAPSFHSAVRAEPAMSKPS